MIKHLKYTIPNNLKVGYGALLTMVFLDFGVDLTAVPVIEMRQEDVFGETRVKNLRMSVVEGYIEEKGEEKEKEKGSGKEKKNSEGKKGTQEQGSGKGKEQEKKKKKRKRIVTKKSVERRKSQRVSAKQRGPTKVTMVVDDSETETEDSIKVPKFPRGTKGQGSGTKEQGSSLEHLEKLMQVSAVTMTELLNHQKELQESQRKFQEELLKKMTSLERSVKSQFDELKKKVDALTVDEESDQSEEGSSS